MNKEDIVHWLYDNLDWAYANGYIDLVPHTVDYCFYLICLLTESEDL